MDFSPNALYSSIHCDLQARFPGLDGNLPPDNGGDPKLFACRHLLGSIVKKYVDDNPRTAARRRDLAVDKFLEVNEACRKYNYKSAMSDAPSWTEICSNEAMREIEELLETREQAPRFQWTDVFESAYFGPGKSLAVSGTSLYAKLATERSCGRKSIYQQWLIDTADTPLGKVEILNRLAGNAVIVDNVSSLSTVAKNRDIDRTTAKGPSINVFYQLGLGVVIGNLLRKRWGIDLETQQALNRTLARLGSATGSLATIDLSSASDTISLELCYNRLPKWFFELLLWLREGHVKIPSRGNKRVPLWMVSTMGNGFTFPLQTMLFGSVVRAAYKLLDIAPRGCDSKNPNYGVNGDDIIVDTRVYTLVCDVLTRWGFTVNSTKSFATGNFRESCGGDYYKGHFVRGVYAQRIRNPQDVVSLINRLVVWSARWDIPLPNAVTYLLSLIRHFPIVPPWEADDAGLKVPQSYLLAVAALGQRRKMKRTWAWSYRGFTHPVWGVCDHTGSIVYQTWAARTPLVPIPRDGANEAGLICTAVKGSTLYRQVTEDGGVPGEHAWGFFTPLRLPQGEAPVYRLCKRVAPGWARVAGHTARDLSVPSVGDARWSRAFVNCIG